MEYRSRVSILVAWEVLSVDFMIRGDSTASIYIYIKYICLSQKTEYLRLSPKLRVVPVDQERMDISYIYEESSRPDYYYENSLSLAQCLCNWRRV